MEINFDQELVDRKEAEFINYLVDEGVISAKKISSADKEVIRELLERNEDEIVLHGEIEDAKLHKIPQDKVEKIKVLLGTDEEQDDSEIEKCIELGTKILLKLKEVSGFPITGILVYGSRLNKQKRPNENSDLDIAIYVNSRDLLVGTDTQMDKWEGIIKQLNLPFAVNINSTFDRHMFSEQLSNYNDFSKARWVMNPNALRFVGTLYIGGQELKDGEATGYIKQKLSDQKWNDARDKRIREIEERIYSLIQ